MALLNIGDSPFLGGGPQAFFWGAGVRASAAEARTALPPRAPAAAAAFFRMVLRLAFSAMCILLDGFRFGNVPARGAARWQRERPPRAQASRRRRRWCSGRRLQGVRQGRWQD